VLVSAAGDTSSASDYLDDVHRILLETFFDLAGETCCLCGRRWVDWLSRFRLGIVGFSMELILSRIEIW
jgi:hypothetical protein